ncbi:General transcription factor IIH subunit 4 [Aphelenchoides fujianensis]|nr:General transcription factor IIH subunit 4 [Aphelenchoides fujianensis]
MASELSDRPFLAYLAQLNADTLEQLYQSEVCCLAVFRLLPPVSQQCVAMMVFSKDFDITQQCNPDLLNVIGDHIVLLQKLRLLVEEKKDKALRLHSYFRYNYMTTTMKSAVEVSGIAVRELDEKAKKATDKDLYKKAVERWECVLSYLALPSDDAKKGVSTATRELFQYVGFTKQSSTLEITSLGFQFLLLSRNEQIWTYLIYHLKFLETTAAEEVVPLLEFFFRLCLCVTGSDVLDRLADDENANVSTPFGMSDHWSESINSFLGHLPRTGACVHSFFFLTPLMASLIATESLREGVLEAGREKGYLITETNYRLYAYTNSALHLSVLSTFTESAFRFPNFVVVHMTRESVRKALQAGITARQITQYLRSNAHYKSIEAHGPLHCVPPTVIDQVHLWEEERERLNCQDCVMYTMFDTEDEYQQMRAHAQRHGVLLFENQSEYLLVVTEDGHELMKEWRQANRGAQ